MKKTCLGLIVTSLLAMVCCLGVAFAQEAQSGAADQEQMMEKWMEFMTPGAEHELLKYKVGKWTGAMEMWMAPDTEPAASNGTTEMKMIMGGRYLVDNTKSDFMGMPFEGMGITGYDNLKKRFVSVWIDNMGTGLMIGTGTYDKATKTYSYAMMSPDVVVGKYKKTRSVERIVSDDQWIIEMYDTTAEGKEYLTMKGTYTRVK